MLDRVPLDEKRRRARAQKRKAAQKRNAATAGDDMTAVKRAGRGNT
jgi:hypothetical protein